MRKPSLPLLLPRRLRSDGPKLIEVIKKNDLASDALAGFFSSFFLAPLADESLPPRAETVLLAALSGGAVLGRFLDDRLMRSSK